MSRTEKYILKQPAWLAICEGLPPKIGRHLTDSERLTLAFILEERWASLYPDRDLLTQLFGLEETDTPIEVCYKIHYQLAQTMERRLLQSYTGWVGEEPSWWTQLRLERLGLLQQSARQIMDFAEQGFLQAEETLPLVGVPHFFVPHWAMKQVEMFSR